MHLAIGLLAQPLYFWKPALDNLILSPRHQLSGTLFSPQSKSSSSSCPSPPAGITVPAIKITLSEQHGKSHFTLGLPDQPTGQTRASENTMGTLSPHRSPTLPGRERHLPHKLAHVDIPHGHTPARPPQALLQHPLEPTSPWPAPLYLLPLKPSNSLKELSTHALCTSSPSACSLTYSRLKFHSHQFIHSFNNTPSTTFGGCQEGNFCGQGHQHTHSRSIQWTLILKLCILFHLSTSFSECILTLPGRIRRLPGHVPSVLSVTPPTAGSPPTSLTAPSQPPLQTSPASTVAVSQGSLDSTLFSHPLLHIRIALVLPKLLMPGPHL